MNATIIQFPRRRREHVEIERRLDAAARPTWHFSVIAADGRRVSVGVRDDIRDAAADMIWFRQGGMRVVAPADFDTDVAQAIAEDFGEALVEELSVEGDATLHLLLDALRDRCVAVMLEMLGKDGTDPIEVLIALCAIGMAMTVREVADQREAEANLSSAELIVGRVAQRRLKALFEQAGGAA